MSLLDRGPHTLLVQNKIPGPPDRYQQPTYVNDGPPKRVRGSMQPLTSTENYELGLTVNTGYRFICRVWPGTSVRSTVTWVDRNRAFIPIGEPADHSTGRRTKHHTVTLQSVGVPVPTTPTGPTTPPVQVGYSDVFSNTYGS